MLSTGEMLVYCGVTILFIVLAYLIGYLVGVKTVIEKEDNNESNGVWFKVRWTIQIRTGNIYSYFYLRWDLYALKLENFLNIPYNTLIETADMSVLEKEDKHEKEN